MLPSVGWVESQPLMIPEAGTGTDLNTLSLTIAGQGRQDEAIALAERALAAGGPHAESARTTLDSLRQRTGNAVDPAD